MSSVGSSWAWTPVVEGARRERIIEVLMEIEDDLGKVKPFGISVSGGAAGISLFFAYFSLLEDPRGKRRLMSENLIGSSAKNLKVLKNNFNFFSGISGVAWAVEHLHNLGIVDCDPEFNFEVNEALMASLSVAHWGGLTELIGGLAGLGVYALEGRRSPAKDAIIAEILRHLFEQAEWSDGCTWFSLPEALPEPARSQSPKGCYNLGLSHGLPGVIAFLSFATHMGYKSALPLLAGSVRWLQRQKNPYPNGSFYGNQLAEGRIEVGSRLSWCYGDLGISLAFHHAAVALADDEIMRESRELALLCAGRADAPPGVVDACLCHGHFGNAHIFNRWFQATGEDSFRVATLKCLDQGLASYRKGRGCGGFNVWSSPLPSEAPRGPWIARSGLLEGTAGMGLALLAAISPTIPNWDRLLAVDIRPIGAWQ